MMGWFTAGMAFDFQGAVLYIEAVAKGFAKIFG
jgi:hypothetical protein